ncbi:Mechanosensitive ion channel-domain-containing protein [Polychytrium aggregatum]|uniref:Mechanosensitive ion channel-domain-containing protein n=1 Tax=Polychytrium aggregatum TaxID=110093 RepID=UPI0022FF447C|nr:Mechanosensitive ion channel-domain-containing protein [Polychytrium aggregatum]KAI9205409.1 Mechanosensitive ion channel-domain-containing protein [Polychytrium aggregatum]
MNSRSALIDSTNTSSDSVDANDASAVPQDGRRISLARDRNPQNLRISVPRSTKKSVGFADSVAVERSDSGAARMIGPDSIVSIDDPIAPRDAASGEVRTSQTETELSSSKEMPELSPHLEMDSPFEWHVFNDRESVFSISKKRGHVYQKYKRCMQKLPMGPRFILYGIFGIALLGIPALVDYLVNLRASTTVQADLQVFNLGNMTSYSELRSINSPWSIGGTALFVWSIFFCILWAVYWLLTYGAAVVPEILSKLYDILVGDNNPEVHTVFDYMRFMKPYVTFFAFAIITLVMFDNTFTGGTTSNPFAFNGGNSVSVSTNGTASTNSSIGTNGTTLNSNTTANNTNSTQTNNISQLARLPWQVVVHKLLLCLLFYAIMLGAERLVMQIFSLSFHKSTYQDRIAKYRHKHAIMEHLNNARLHHKLNRVTNGQKPGEAAPNEAKSPVKFQAAALRQIESKIRTAKYWAKDVGGLVSRLVGTTLGMDVQIAGESIMVQSRKEAVALAKGMWTALRKDKRSMILTVSDFEPYFDTAEEAAEAFSIFDADGNGDLTMREFRAAVIKFFEERNSLEISLRDTGSTVGKLDNMVMSIVYIIVLLVSVGIWNIDISSFMTAIAAVWLGTLFAISGIITNAVENILFLFFSHPFDSGDLIEVQGQRYYVKECRIMQANLKRQDGKEVYVSNAALSKQKISNIRRSGAITEDVKFQVDFTTTRAQVAELQKYMIAFVEDNGREFNPSINFHLVQILSKYRQLFFRALIDGLSTVGISTPDPDDLLVRLNAVPPEVLGWNSEPSQRNSDDRDDHVDGAAGVDQSHL